jgi:hypothetical protein
MRSFAQDRKGVPLGLLPRLRGRFLAELHGLEMMLKSIGEFLPAQDHRERLCVFRLVNITGQERAIQAL